MFEETIRTLRMRDGTTSIPVSISCDEEGYFDRECPSEECEFQLKVHLEGWKAKVRDGEFSARSAVTRRIPLNGIRKNRSST